MRGNGTATTAAKSRAKKSANAKVMGMCGALKVNGKRIKCSFGVDHNRMAKFYVPTMSDTFTVTSDASNGSELATVFPEISVNGGRAVIKIRPGASNYDAVYRGYLKTRAHDEKRRLKNEANKPASKRANALEMSKRYAYVDALEQLI